MRFLAAVNGVELDDKSEEDVVDLQGRRAQQEGFGIGEGLGFIEL